MPSQSTKSLVWYAAAYGGSAALLKGAGFVLFFWLARSMSVEQYAEFGLSYALQTGIATFAIAGIVESVVGHIRNDDPCTRRRLLAAANTVFALLGGIATVAAGAAFGVFFRSSGQSFEGFAFVVLAGLLTSFFSLQASLVRLDEKHLSSLSFSFFGPLAALVGGLVGFVLLGTVSAFFFGSAIFLGSALIGFRVFKIGLYQFASNIRETKPILRQLSPFIGIAFLGWLSGYGSNYLIQGFFPPTEIARFTFAFTLASIMQLVASSLNQVWSPRFYRIIRQQPADEVEIKNRRFFRWQAVAMGLVGAVAIVLAPLTIDLIGGNLIAYRDMQIELTLLFAAYVILPPWWHAQNYFLIHGEGRQLMRIVLRTSLIGTAAWLLLMAVLGPIGIYIGFAVQMLVRMMGAVKNAGMRWPITIAWEGVAIGLALLCLGFSLSQSL